MRKVGFVILLIVAGCAVSWSSRDRISAADGVLDGCAYISEATASVRFFRSTKINESRYSFEPIEGDSLLVNSSAECPEAPFIPKDCAINCVIDVGSESGNRFSLSKSYRNWEKFERLEGEQVNVFLDGKLTSVYGKLVGSRTYVALNEFCFVFGCNYGYLEGNEGKKVTVSYDVNKGSSGGSGLDVFVREVDIYLEEQVYESFSLLKKILTDSGREAARERAKASGQSTYGYNEDVDVASIVVGDSQDIPTMDDVANKSVAFNEADVLVPVRFLAESLGQRVTWVPEDSSVLIDGLDANIAYTKDVPGEFIFINEREIIQESDLAESGELIYEHEINGDVEIYYEHTIIENEQGACRPPRQMISLSGICALGVFYGISYTNEGSSSAVLKIDHCGLSTNDALWLAAWKQYYDDPANCIEGGVTEFNIASGETKYFWHSGNNNGLTERPLQETPGMFLTSTNKARKVTPTHSHWAVGFDGVMAVEASRPLKVKVFATAQALSDGSPDISKVITARYTGGKVIDSSVMSAYADMLPEVKNEAVFVINDDTSGKLDVMLNGRQTNEWLVNDSGCTNMGGVAMTDIIPLQYQYRGRSYTVGNRVEYEQNNAADPRSGNCNIWPNYAVHYTESIVIDNRGEREREVIFSVGGPQDNVTVNTSKLPRAIIAADKKATNAVFSGDSSKDQFIRYDNSEGAAFYTTKDRLSEIWRVRVPAGQVSIVDCVVTLGGMSFGTLARSVEVVE